MSRYIKKPRPEPEDETSARYWLKGVWVVVVWQAGAFLLPFVLGASAKTLAAITAIAVVVSAIWLRRNTS
jgi:hypothetical protein